MPRRAIGINSLNDGIRPVYPPFVDVRRRQHPSVSRHIYHKTDYRRNGRHREAESPNILRFFIKTECCTNPLQWDAASSDVVKTDQGAQAAGSQDACPRDWGLALAHSLINDLTRLEAHILHFKNLSGLNGYDAMNAQGMFDKRSAIPGLLVVYPYVEAVVEDRLKAG